MGVFEAPQDFQAQNCTRENWLFVFDKMGRNVIEIILFRVLSCKKLLEIHYQDRSKNQHFWCAENMEILSFLSKSNWGIGARERCEREIWFFGWNSAVGVRNITDNTLVTNPHAHTHTRTNTHTHTHTKYTRTLTHTRTQQTHKTHASAHKHTHTHTCTHTHTYTHTRTRTPITHVTHSHINTRHAYTHTHT